MDIYAVKRIDYGKVIVSIGYGRHTAAKDDIVSLRKAARKISEHADSLADHVYKPCGNVVFICVIGYLAEVGRGRFVFKDPRFAFSYIAYGKIDFWEVSLLGKLTDIFEVSCAEKFWGKSEKRTSSDASAAEMFEAVAFCMDKKLRRIISIMLCGAPKGSIKTETNREGVFEKWIRNK